LGIRLYSLCFHPFSNFSLYAYWNFPERFKRL